LAKSDKADDFHVKRSSAVLFPGLKRKKRMSDEHQVNAIIATSISDSRRDHPDGRIDPEEAKQMAKCIMEALASAGLEIMPVSKE
jgi:hypothetical protein